MMFVLQSLVDMAPKYILEQFLQQELLINITEHEVRRFHCYTQNTGKEKHNKHSLSNPIILSELYNRTEIVFNKYCDLNCDMMNICC